MIILYLILASLLTAIISATTGMGGGILLFSVMTLILPLKTIIPLHGLVQFFSNSSRIYFMLSHIRWRPAIYFFIGSSFGALIAFIFLKEIGISENLLMTLVCVLILFSLFKPKKLPQIKISEKAHLPLGIMSGCLGILIGTIGPFLAVFFIRDDYTKEEIIANKSVLQWWIHLLKFPIFLGLGFNYFDWTSTWLPMVIASIVGTKLGIMLLGKMNDQVFKLLFKSALFLAAIRILYKVLF